MDQVAQARLRSSGRSDEASGGRAYHGTVDCLLKIYRHEGSQGLFSGVQTKLWHSAFISALMFLTYEKIQRTVERALGVAHPAVTKR